MRQPINIKPNVAYLNDRWEPCYWLTALFGNSFRGGHVKKWEETQVATQSVKVEVVTNAGSQLGKAVRTYKQGLFDLGIRF